MLLLLSVYMYVALDSIDGHVAILAAFHKYFACGNKDLIVLSYIVTNIRAACWFSVPVMSQCASFVLI